jgi:hypothetical protein
MLQVKYVVPFVRVRLVTSMISKGHFMLHEFTTEPEASGAMVASGSPSSMMEDVCTLQHTVAIMSEDMCWCMSVWSGT